MGYDKESSCYDTYVNCLVAALLDQVADVPIPEDAEDRIAEICACVSEEKATLEMALEIIQLFFCSRSA